MKRKITVIVLFAFLTVNVSAQNFDELERTVEAELREKNAFGAGVTIVKNDKIVFAKGFGTANIETGAPVTPDTLFQIGSITKTFTAAMILSLAEEGKLKLDQPIGSYAKNLSPKLSRVTLNQLLSHTAGIIDEPDEYGAADESLMATYIRSWTDDYCLFDGGEVFSYSNSGFALAGFTAQEASRKLYADLMTERIFASIKDGKLFVKEFNQELPLTKIGENRFSFQFPQAKQPVEIYVKPVVGGKNGFVHQYVRAFKKI